jgi:signal transduction histidine kinase/HAMP domain-containing protein
MSVELWGFDGSFSLGLPMRVLGYGLLGLYVLSLGFLLIASRPRTQSASGSHPPAGRLIFLVFLALAPIAAQVLVFQLPIPGALPAPGLPREPSAPVFSLFGSLPWMLAAGLLGGWQAAVVALLGGLARGGWSTLSILTPAHFALQAGLAAWMLRQDYAEAPGRAARSPLFTSLIVGILFGALGAVELFVNSGGSLVDGVEYSLSRLTPTMLAAILEAGSAGVVCEAIRIVLPEVWYRPARLVPGPYNRSLAGRMLTVFGLLSIIGGGIMLYGDWLLARASAQDLVQTQMTQTADLVAGGIPYFVQTGRSLIREQADDLAGQVTAGSVNQEALNRALRRVPFFAHIDVFDLSGKLLAEAPAADTAFSTEEIGPALAISLEGIPQETIASPLPGSQGARLVFLSPLVAADGGKTLGAVAGWTDLAANPFLVPIMARLQSIQEGEAYLADDRGRVVMDPDPRRLMQTVDVPEAGSGGVVADTAPDGTRRITLSLAVEGYPWRAVISVPQRVVDTLAAQIATRLFAVIVIVFALMMAVVYAGSQRLTRPLRIMAGVAESIAEGNLAQPVRVAGEDEIARLAASFEHMRRALQSRLNEMDLLLAASKQMSSTFDLPVVLPPILQGVQRLLRVDLVNLALSPPPGEENARLEVYRAGRDPGNWKSLDAQILALCRQRGAFYLENPARAKAVIHQQDLTEPIQGLMSVPMRDEDEFVGAIWLGFRRPHPFSEEEGNLLSIVAGQLAISVANARLYQRAEQERSRLAGVLEATPDAVLVTDGRGRVSLANPAAESVLRGNAEDALGKPATESVIASEVLELLRAGSEMRTAEVTLPGGRVLFATASDIQPGGRVCILWDVTHFKKLDMLKSEFVSTVSHDLRAPLTLMRGYATMLSMVGAMNEQQKEFVRKISESVEQMTQLVDNLLDLGRIEAGVGLNLEAVTIDHVVQDVAGAYQPQALNKRIALEVDMGQGMRPIEADPTLLRQAIANLVDNAIKYTQPGGRVTLRARQHDGRQMISVEDSGVGIAPTDQARLFEKFYRARRPDTLKEKGSGLGLAIVKSIIEQHGGRVSVESRLGVGSTFTVEIPARIISPESTLDSRHS